MTRRWRKWHVLKWAGSGAVALLLVCWLLTIVGYGWQGAWNGRVRLCVHEGRVFLEYWSVNGPPRFVETEYHIQQAQWESIDRRLFTQRQRPAWQQRDSLRAAGLCWPSASSADCTGLKYGISGKAAELLGDTSVIGRTWLVPLWLPVLLIGAVTIVCWRLDRPPRAGHCPACGYDLTGNTTGRCPECGSSSNVVCARSVRRHRRTEP